MHFTKTLGFAGLVAAAEYDYIVVGGGPSGIIAAERLSAADKSVLLLERGQGPTVDTGANVTLPWNDELTEIDVPGLSATLGSSDLWSQYICDDTPPMAACVLGGGPTVNFMVFVHPPDHDFENWNWKSEEIQSAAERLYSRNPGTTLPSADGKLYPQGLYASLSKVLDRFGFSSVDMIEEPNAKHEVYSHPSWNIDNQLRAGPLRTYLPHAKERDNFELRTETKVNRLIREGAKVTGVEIEAGLNSTEVISLSPNGRVVLAAGALSSPRLLWNSGIGRAEDIEAAIAGGIDVPSKDQWINLPVGEGLMDHPIFSLELKAANESFAPIDAKSILDGSALESIENFEVNKSGDLAEGKHELIFFTSREGSDGQTRFFQGSCAAEDEGIFSIKIYLTHGLTSTGRLSLNETQTTYLSEKPYLTTEADKQAAEEFVSEMLNKLLSRGTGYQLTKSTNVTSIIENLSGGNHFVGSTRMGVDSGLENGTAVVDLNTQVYGTDNLFIVDAGIHPDLATGNIQTIVMVAAEAAVAKILACENN
ncbi:hypothetical protein Q7P37_003803 [Cladosporium fusiforme]